MYLIGPYGVSHEFRFPMNVQGTTDFAQGADWTPVAGDVKISIDGANYVNTTNLPVISGGAGAAGWKLVLTNAELTGEEINVQIIDAAVKAVSDQFLVIYTENNAAAKFGVDQKSTAPNANVVRVGGEFLVLGGTGNQKFGS